MMRAIGRAALVLSVLAVCGCGHPTDEGVPGGTLADADIQKDVLTLVSVREASTSANLPDVRDTRVVGDWGGGRIEEWTVDRGDSLVYYAVHFVPGEWGTTVGIAKASSAPLRAPADAGFPDLAGGAND
jgi:hypothetical protein